jgi:hypothetical protein
MTETRPRDWGEYRYYRVEGGDLWPGAPADPYVGVDPLRSVRDGDLVVVETADDHRHVLGHLREADADAPALVTAGRVLRLRGHALLGVVALVVQEM